MESYDVNAKAVIEKLKERGYHISFAESCTGGIAVARLVDVPDASSVLDASLVTYANSAKINFLDVKEETINTYGVVSENVAEEMAKGVARINSAEVGVGISGIAGPTGATPTKPICMLFFGFYIDGRCLTFTKQFGEIGRQEVRRKSVDFVYEKLLELL